MWVKYYFLINFVLKISHVVFTNIFNVVKLNVHHNLEFNANFVITLRCHFHTDFVVIIWDVIWISCFLYSEVSRFYVSRIRRENHMHVHRTRSHCACIAGLTALMKASLGYGYQITLSAPQKPHSSRLKQCVTSYGNKRRTWNVAQLWGIETRVFSTRTSTLFTFNILYQIYFS
jgi:hypothetical protein